MKKYRKRFENWDKRREQNYKKFNKFFPRRQKTGSENTT